MSPDEDENGMLYFNGVNGDRGGYELEPISTGDLFKIITDETDGMGEEAQDDLKELRYRYEQREIDYLGVKQGVNANNLGEAGWGIIFAHGADPEIKEALSELIELRRAQAGDYFYLYEGPDAYRPGESKRKFLARHGVGPGPADPEKVPYYLLIVGDPEAIPYRFQSQLDVQYAVGRIYFESLDEYAHYARSVVAAETGQRRSPRRARFFGVANEDDRATQRTTRDLVEPLFQKIQGSDPEWDFDLLVKDKATKANLAGLLGGDQTPGLLFTASHGMNFDLGSPNQIPHQGALLCQDWPGPEQWPNPFPQEFYFSAEDVADEVDLQGMIAFFFACFGAGTPTLDQFVKRALGHQRVAIAPHNFLARLPMAMLGRPRGGALAVVGHVDRALSYSFRWPGAGVQTTVFESTLNSLMSGDTVGSAVEYFNERYAELSTVLSDELEDIEFGKVADPGEITGMWAANNDARGYALIGDPAVRLKYGE